MLVDLHYNPDSSQGEVVERLGIEQPTIAKTLTRMQRAGFVEQTRDKSDRRLSRLRLPRHGQQAVDAVITAWQDADTAIAAALSDGQLRELIGLLDHVGAPRQLTNRQGRPGPTTAAGTALRTENGNLPVPPRSSPRAGR